VVRVADREGIGKLIVKRDVVAREVRHRRRALVRHPLIVAAAVPRAVRRGPVVRQVLQKLQAEIRRSRTERQHFADTAEPRLMPHRLAVRQIDCARIAETAHAFERAEVVVERTVFLHQDHDVFGIQEG
jgi:hypothetical protein